MERPYMSCSKTIFSIEIFFNFFDVINDCIIDLKSSLSSNLRFFNANDSNAPFFPNQYYREWHVLFVSRQSSIRRLTTQFAEILSFSVLGPFLDYTPEPAYPNFFIAWDWSISIAFKTFSTDGGSRALTRIVMPVKYCALMRGVLDLR